MTGTRIRHRDIDLPEPDPAPAFRSIREERKAGAPHPPHRKRIPACQTRMKASGFNRQRRESVGSCLLFDRLADKRAGIRLFHPGQDFPNPANTMLLGESDRGKANLLIAILQPLPHRPLARLPIHPHQ